jgi:hypothetical protein
MPKIEKKAEEANSEPMIPLDDSGPAVDVELPKPKASEVKEKEKEVEVKEVEEVKEKKEEPVVAPTANAKKEIKKDELDDYSANVKKRIEKLTFKLREAERREKAATDYAESVKTRFDDLDKNYLQQASDRVKSETEKSKELLKKAIEEGDADKIVDLNQQIATLAVDDARVKAAEENIKTNEKTKPAGNTTEAPASDQRPQPDPKAEAWAAKNSWFGSNEAMTYTAFAIHKKLVEQEGFDPHSDTYYEEVDKRIRDEFPHKFDGEKADTGQQKPAQAVASATRSTKTGRKTVRLTPSQVAIAKKLGVPLEEYAKYVKEDN